MWAWTQPTWGWRWGTSAEPSWQQPGEERRPQWEAEDAVYVETAFPWRLRGTPSDGKRCNFSQEPLEMMHNGRVFPILYDCNLVLSCGRWKHSKSPHSNILMQVDSVFGPAEAKLELFTDLLEVASLQGLVSHLTEIHVSVVVAQLPLQHTETPESTRWDWLLRLSRTRTCVFLYVLHTEDQNTHSTSNACVCVWVC